MKFTSALLLVAAVAAVGTASAQENPCITEIATVCNTDMTAVNTPRELDNVKACLADAVARRTMCVNDWCSPCHEFATASADDAKVLAACATDAQTGRCSKYSDNQTVVNCLEHTRARGHGDTLSQTCQDELAAQDVLLSITNKVVDAAKAAWAAMNKGRTACKADQDRLCPAMDKMEARRCFRDASAATPTTLSSDCFDYVSSFARRPPRSGGGGGKKGGGKPRAGPPRRIRGQKGDKKMVR